MAQSSTRSHAPDIFSEAYDPFATFHTHSSLSPAALEVSSTPTHVPDLSSSPSSCDMSTRSSFSYARGEPYSTADYGPDPGPKIKPEDSHNWLAMRGSEARVQGYLNLAPARPLSSADTPPFEPAPRNYSLSPGQAEEPGVAGRGDVRRRKKRRLTTAADATHTCHVCGKLFGRSYNFKAHMETHDPGRVYAHPCQVQHCDKKFVRKTDLMRHHQSVHMKQRNYQCELCGNMFARKDTLRRHTEDGCAKRFEISTIESSMYRSSSLETRMVHVAPDTPNVNDASAPTRPRSNPAFSAPIATLSHGMPAPDMLLQAVSTGEHFSHAIAPHAGLHAAQQPRLDLFGHSPRAPAAPAYYW
ncbi:MAG: hypothetical protein M1838_001244 [Thelocarpon superellum]|nr:MAG: hypothetical protein M1838_001244 [Thelocarpon superellum]